MSEKRFSDLEKAVSSLEKTNVFYERTMLTHIKHDDETLKGIESSIEGIYSKVEKLVDKVSVDIRASKADADTRNDLKYLSLTDATALIEKARKDTINTLTLTGSAMLSVLTFCAWLYVQSIKIKGG